MKTLNKTTKGAKAWIDKYNKSSCTSVLNFYGSCSSAKMSAEYQCKKRMKELNCYGYCVLSGNCFHFVCGYRNEKYLYIETVGYTYQIEL